MIVVITLWTQLLTIYFGFSVFLTIVKMNIKKWQIFKEYHINIK